MLCPAAFMASTMAATKPLATMAFRLASPRASDAASPSAAASGAEAEGLGVHSLMSLRHAATSFSPVTRATTCAPAS